jgi:hypothetical protein
MDRASYLALLAAGTGWVELQKPIRASELITPV